MEELIAGLKGVLSTEDVEAVKQSVTFDGEVFSERNSAETIDSKYRPDKCSKPR